MDNGRKSTLKVSLALLYCVHGGSAEDGSGGNFALIAAGSVAGLLFLVLIFMCMVAIRRRCFRKDETKKRRPNILAIAAETDLVSSMKSTTMQSKRSSHYSHVYDNAAGVGVGGKKVDYWSRQERRGKSTEDKIRRMNLPIEVDDEKPRTLSDLGVTTGNHHTPPPPILRTALVENVKKRSDEADSRLTQGSAGSNAGQSSRTSSSRDETDQGWLKTYDNVPPALDNRDEPSTSTYQPPSPHEEVASGSQSGPVTPKPHHFRQPQELYIDSD